MNAKHKRVQDKYRTDKYIAKIVRREKRENQAFKENENHMKKWCDQEYENNMEFGADLGPEAQNVNIIWK